LYSISPFKAEEISIILTKNKLKYEVIFNDLQNLIDSLDDEVNSNSLGITSFFDKYQRNEEINAYFQDLIVEYPYLVESFSIGKTFEGRDINGVIIKSPNSTETRDIFFHGGIHAREWIGPATVSYIATELIKGYGKDVEITRLIDRFTFHIIPVLNVDGYIYSHTTNRMWRKNRQPNQLFCTGTDLNRNWDAGWSGPGASSNPCSDAYYGSKPFSAPESLAVSKYIEKLSNSLVAYLDIHAFSQLWMYPYGYDCKKVVSNAPKMKEVSTLIVRAIKGVHGTSFANGPICDIIYQASGSSIDWAVDNFNIPYAFAVELRDTGRYGFLLPPKYIIPSGQEILAGIIAMGNALI
jgi:murein tripeptide amidase MpaA